MVVRVAQWARKLNASRTKSEERMPSTVSLLDANTDRATTAVADLPEGVTIEEELERCRVSFPYFLRYWRFEDRETGVIRSFSDPWPAQREVAEMMMEHPRLYLLKAGKLGFTELECAYDGWVLRFRQQNARVHVFSMDGTEAKILAKIVRDGMSRLPPWMRLPVAKDEAGSDTTQQIRWYAGVDDYRTLRAYPSTQSASIANSCVHAHIDELARMPWPEETYSAATSTVPAHGTLHIVTRGAGQGSYSDELWEKAQTDASVLVPVFFPFWGRPRQPVGAVPEGATQEEKNRIWYEEQRGEFTSLQQLYMFAPRTAEEALAPNAEESFVPIEHWDAAYDPELPELEPGDETPAVLALDAGVSNDYFAAALVTRDPRDTKVAALRHWMVWKPEATGGVVDFAAVENWVRMVCLGGCVQGHPNPNRSELSYEEGCEACAQGYRIQRYNIRHLTADPYQLHDMMQRLSREGLTWYKPFDQGQERLQADAKLRQLIMKGTGFKHRDNPLNKSDMRQAISNAKIKVPKGEDSRARMEKRNDRSKIDLAVALSMAVHRALWLRIG